LYAEFQAKGQSMLYGKHTSSVKGGTQRNTKPGQRPDWRFRLVQKQRQGAERAATSTLNGEFYAAHTIDAQEAIQRHGRASDLPPTNPTRRARRSSGAPLKTHVVQRDGEQPYTVQTSSRRILRPPTEGMRQMVAALLISGEVEVREAA
jgi:hypothetical protein